MELRVVADFTKWFPRAAEHLNAPLPPVGFSDVDTVAAIIPPQVHSLTLGPSTPFSAGALQSLAMGCLNLFVVSIEMWCDDDALSSLARSAPNLITLTLSQCAKLTDLGLRVCAQFVRSLQTLKLCECNQITDAGLSVIVRNNGDSLRTLAFPFCERITDLSLTQVAASCGRTLQSLDVSGNRLVTPTGLLLLFTDECRLESLSINFCPGAVTIDVALAILEFGWTINKVSCAFSDVIPSSDDNPAKKYMTELVQKIRTRGCDFLC